MSASLMHCNYFFKWDSFDPRVISATGHIPDSAIPEPTAELRIMVKLQVR